MKNAKIWVVLGLLGVIVAVFCHTSIRNMDQELLERRERIESLCNEIAVLQNTREQNRTRLQLESTGVSNERMAGDVEHVRDFAECLLNWTSYVEYMAQREQMKTEYEQPEDGYILSILMPYITSTTTPDGTVYNPIDGRDGTPGVESRCSDLMLHCVRIQDRDYTYVAIVEWTVSSKEQPGVGEEELIVLLTVDEDGKVFNIQPIV